MPICRKGKMRPGIKCRMHELSIGQMFIAPQGPGALYQPSDQILHRVPYQVGKNSELFKDMPDLIQSMCERAGVQFDAWMDAVTTWNAEDDAGLCFFIGWIELVCPLFKDGEPVRVTVE